MSAGLASNGYAAHSPGGYSLFAGLVSEVVMTFMFLIITSVQPTGARRRLRPIAIGLGLTLIHLISIPVTNTSVNPARSTGPAVFVGRLGARAAVAVLGGATHRRRARRGGLSLAGRGSTKVAGA